jgi:hypothetical protein
MEAYIPYIERVLQPTPVVMGLRMRPLTLGHMMLLKSLGSRFATGDIRQCTFVDLIQELALAVMICSDSYDSVQEEIHAGTFQQTARKHFDQYLKQLEKAVDNHFNLMAEIRLFSAYLKKGTTGPAYNVKLSEGDANVSVNPVEVEETMMSTVMSDCGYTRNECLNLPLTEILSAYLLHAHKNDAIELTSKEEIEMFNELKGTDAQ